MTPLGLVLALGLAAGSAAEGLVPRLELRALPEAAIAPAVAEPSLKSPSLAFGLTLASELPTLLIGPSAGHLYAGESRHFWLSGGSRIGTLLTLVFLEKWMPGFGVGPLYAVSRPGHLGRSFAAYPIAFPVDLALVLGLVGSGAYDLVDSWFAAKRANAHASSPASPPPPPAKIFQPQP